MDADSIVQELEAELVLCDTHIQTLYAAIEAKDAEIWTLLQQNEDLKREVTQLLAEKIYTSCMNDITNEFTNRGSQELKKLLRSTSIPSGRHFRQRRGE